MGYLSSPTLGIRDLFEDSRLFILGLAQIFAVMCYYSYGLVLIREVSSMFRAFWEVSENFIVIAFSLILGFEHFIVGSFIVKIFGLLFLILGNLIYNEIIEVRYMGLNTDLRKYSNLKLSNSLM